MYFVYFKRAVPPITFVVPVSGRGVLFVSLIVLTVTASMIQKTNEQFILQKYIYMYIYFRN